MYSSEKEADLESHEFWNVKYVDNLNYSVLVVFFF